MGPPKSRSLGNVFDLDVERPKGLLDLEGANTLRVQRVDAVAVLEPDEVVRLEVG